VNDNAYASHPSLNASDFLSRLELLALLVDLGKDLSILEEVVLVLANLDRRAAPAGEEDAVTDVDRNGDDGALLVGSAGADGDDGSLGEGRLGRGRGEEEARGGLLWGLLVVCVDL
jgi:hypothetical protein